MRVQGEALVEEASFGALFALRVSPDGLIWVGGEGRVWRQEPNRSWSSWDLSFPLAQRPGGVAVPSVRALVFDDDATVLLGTTEGLLRLDPADGAVSQLPLMTERTPDIFAAERLRDVLYLGTGRGLLVVLLRVRQPLATRTRLAPHYTPGLDLDGSSLLVSSNDGSYRIDALGLKHTLIGRPWLCPDCSPGAAIARGDRVAWVANGHTVRARPTGWREPDPCGTWSLPIHDPAYPRISDLSMAPDGTLWAATYEGLHALDTASCVGRTLLWPG